MNNKCCNKCNITKNLSEFAKRKSSKDGLMLYCKLCYSLERREWYSKNKEHVSNYKKSRYINKDRDRELAYKEKYYIRNRHLIIQSKIEYRKNNINAMLKHKLRSRLNQAIHRNERIGSAVKNLGCSIEDLKRHLESQFQPGMSWDNYGSWHIDHIDPLANFDLTDQQGLKAACHYTNLQPLWAKDNLSKGAKCL